MKTYTQFKETFDNEVKSEIRSDYFMGFFFILLGVSLTFLIELNIIKYQGTKTFHYAGFSFMILMGLTVLYWIKIRYKISTFDKECTDEEMEKGIEQIREKYNMDILNNDQTFYTFFYKPGTLTPWTEVYLFYDNDKIYINARPISKGNVDFGFAKRLEKKLVAEIKTSR